MRSSRSKFSFSQQSGPIVPGANRNLYVWVSSRSISCFASIVATAIPDRLSLASDGWQR